MVLERIYESLNNTKSCSTYFVKNVQISFEIPNPLILSHFRVRVIQNKSKEMVGASRDSYIYIYKGVCIYYLATIEASICKKPSSKIKNIIIMRNKRKHASHIYLSITYALNLGIYASGINTRSLTRVWRAFVLNCCKDIW